MKISNFLGMIAAAALRGSGPVRLGRRYGPLHTRGSGYRHVNPLNRSQNWRPAMSYKHARAMSPYPERAVR